MVGIRSTNSDGSEQSQRQKDIEYLIENLYNRPLAEQLVWMAWKFTPPMVIWG